MDQQVKSKWIEALRSGKYQQGTGRLRRDDHFCCLGVLCDIVSPEKWNDDEHNWHNMLPSPEVMEGSGFNKYSYSPRIPVPDDYIVRCGEDLNQNTIALSNLNDHGYTFNEIADLIEKHL